MTPRDCPTPIEIEPVTRHREGVPVRFIVKPDPREGLTQRTDTNLAISSDGRVWREYTKFKHPQKHSWGRVWVGYWFRGSKNNNGCPQVAVGQVESGSRMVLLARLVATAWLPNPQNLPFVRHKDGNLANNRVTNLEWCVHIYNMRQTHKRYQRKRTRT